jgi:murein DD-endopeptidase MepM/ murein hydrolase activator NlpD
MRPPRRLFLLPFAALIIGLAIPPTIGGAQTNDRKRELEAALAEAGQAEAAALLELQDIQTRKAAIDARVREIDLQLADAEVRLTGLEEEAARLAAEYTAVYNHLLEVQARLDRAQTRLNSSAAGLYRSERRGTSYDSILTQRPENVVAQKEYLEQVSDGRRQIVKRVTTLRNDVEEQRAKVEAQKAEADAAAAEARAVRDEIARLRAEIEPARAEAAAAAKAEQEQLYVIRSNKASYERELAAMRAVSDYIGAQLAKRGGIGGGAPCNARPVPGPITSGYGMRYHPVLHYNRMHTGADMRASSGTPILACRAGTVVIASWQGGYGNAVVIDHGDGMGTLYAHQSRLGVSEGQVVHSGDVIGYVGSTGMSTGAHLHFEVRLGGNHVDPAPYL